MAGQLEYSTTAASNTAVNSIGVQGTSSISNFDNAVRQMMADTASAITRHVTKSTGSYTAAKTDYNQFWRATGAVTVNLTAAATLTDGWCIWLKADGGDITVDPNSTEEINGATTLTVPNGASAFVLCTGAAFYAFVAISPSALSAYQPLNTVLTALTTAFTVASSSGPASLQFAEDTDNGTNKVTVTAPASLSGDVTLTLPSASGTALTSADILDEDDMASDSNTKVPTQQSVKAYVDANAAKAWVNFNGTGTVAIRDSYNVSSVTDNNTGDYTVNFTNAMPNANYAVALGGKRAAGTISTAGTHGHHRVDSRSTSSVTVFGANSGGDLAADWLEVDVIVFGD